MSEFPTIKIEQARELAVECIFSAEEIYEAMALIEYDPRCMKLLGGMNLKVARVIIQQATNGGSPIWYYAKQMTDVPKGQ